MPAILINKKNYKKEIKRCKTPVLLSFPTHGVSSLLLKQTADTLSDEYKGKIKVGVTDSGNSELVKKYNINFMPMTVLIKDNTVTDRIIGTADIDSFRKILLE